MDEIYIYEDEGYKRFLPLVYLRPIFDLYCGMYTFKQRIQKLYPNSNIYPVSRFHIQTFRRPNKEVLFINGRAILHSPLPKEEGIFISQEEIIGIRGTEINLQDILKNRIPKRLKKINVNATIIKYPWDLIKENRETIIKDFKLTQKPNNLWIDKGAKIEEGVFLNTEKGAIYIENKVHIRPLSIIDGPCYIGEGSLIDGAKIRMGTTIGKGCKIGGEVEESIFSDFSNKHHEGFIGHSFIGEWVNLGALTTTSDLKNTYGEVKIKIEKQELATGIMKLGAFIGDHTKTGIGTLLPTGCVVGCFSNIFGGGEFPKYIPPFSWGTRDNFTQYKLTKAIEVAKRVMQRRGKEMTPEYQTRIRKAFNIISLNSAL
jgi:UDP-N-acetylglucosamine diphosphorylase/glucosamine-1-phosphate N-acetyltransferase